MSQSAEELADRHFDEMQQEYDRAHGEVRKIILANLDEFKNIIDIHAELRNLQPPLNMRYVNAALADLRGPLYYQDSAGVISRPKPKGK